MISRFRYWIMELKSLALKPLAIAWLAIQLGVLFTIQHDPHAGEIIFTLAVFVVGLWSFWYAAIEGWSVVSVLSISGRGCIRHFTSRIYSHIYIKLGITHFKFVKVNEPSFMLAIDFRLLLLNTLQLVDLYTLVYKYAGGFAFVLATLCCISSIIVTKPYDIHKHRRFKCD